MMILIRFLKRNFATITINKCSSVFSKLVGLVHSFFYAKFNSFFSKTALNLSYIFTCIFLALLILINLVLGMYDTYSLFSETTIDSLLNVLPEGGPNDKVPMDPRRWWPNGVPQSTAIVGTGLTIFGILSRLSNVPSILRVLGALAASGVKATQISYQSAIENSLGFNRLMWDYTVYQKTGIWPSLEKVAETTSYKDIKGFAAKAIDNVDQSKVDAIIKEVTDKGANSLCSSDISDYVQKLFEVIFKEIMQILKPVQVQGFFDDLIGQRMFIEVILFIMCLLVIILFIIFILNLIFILNIAKIKNRFQNKFILFYLKYQTYLSWITLIYIPIFIFIGLLTIFHGLYWLIVNQIPYECLDVDLHTFISSKNIVLGMTLTSAKKISEASNNEAGSSTSCSGVINKFIPDSSEMEKLSIKILEYLLETFSSILQPVQSQYSNEVLANQIHDLAILLFIMSLLITILILCLLINIVVVLNSDRIINFFTNKYIRWYVSVNLKLIGIEVFCLGASIIYFMYSLSTGLHYIATHPIQFP